MNQRLWGKFGLAILLIAGLSMTFMVLKPDASSPGRVDGLSAEIQLPLGPPIPEELQFEKVEDRFSRNSNLRDVLDPHGFTPQQIHKMISGTRDAYNLNRVMAGHRFSIEHDLEGRFRRFEYDIDESRYLVVTPQGEDYVGVVEVREFETSIEEVGGRIRDSLWNTLVGLGESGQLVMGIHELMQWDIDFTVIQPDDSFKLIFEKKFYDGEFVKYGPIHAMEFTHGGRAFHAFRFDEPGTGKVKYYDRDGKGVKKAFLKVPFRYDYRISSGFSYSRLHPVSGVRRPHLGIDYAAPTGTPVLASAAGRVTFAGWKGANGNMVKIRHANGFHTYYLHLSRILVKVGRSVAQGDRIGLVGATGVATGPHLDYRIQDNKGRFLNPKKHVALPSDTGVPDTRMKEFQSVRDEYLRQLDEIRLPAEPADTTAIAG